jgi:hypothetical protein
MRAWHFVGEKLRDGRPVPADGEWLEHEGPLVMCRSGLHAGERAWYALHYASGPVLCLVELDGEMIEGEDKVVARRRKIIVRRDITDLLRRFAREEALRVTHLWDCPEVVRRYLETGDESLRDAARDAAWAAAGVAARAAYCAASDGFLVPWSIARSASRFSAAASVDTPRAPRDRFNEAVSREGL